MSKKQQTLQQLWGSQPKPKPVPKPVIDEVTLLSDDDDALFEAVFEETMKKFDAGIVDEVTGSVTPLPGGSGIPSATAVESLPGFDNGAGDTWIYPTNYAVRKYQLDIVETCLFHNTLVALPTGLGSLL